MGCDRTIWKPRGTSHRFQSTNPSGVRLGDGAARGDVAEISIHAPQWGATVIPHPVVGSCIISIHAPQWGATTDGVQRLHDRQVFQSTHPSGVRHWRPTGSPPRCRFQSTHPSGVRPQRPSRSWRFRRNFNPRTPVGCDDRGRNHHPNSQISIHAPQWGATDRYADCYTGLQFQSTHPSGVRRPRGRRCGP